MGGLLDQWQSNRSYMVPIYCSHGGRVNAPASRRQSTTPVSRSSQAAALAPVQGSERSSTRCMEMLHFRGPAPVESIFTPLLSVHDVQGHADPTLPLPCHLPPSYPSLTPTSPLQPTYHPPQTDSHSLWSTERNPNLKPNYYTYTHDSKATNGQEYPSNVLAGLIWFNRLVKYVFTYTFPFFWPLNIFRKYIGKFFSLWNISHKYLQVFPRVSRHKWHPPENIWHRASAVKNTHVPRTLDFPLNPQPFSIEIILPL